MPLNSMLQSDPGGRTLVFLVILLCSLLSWKWVSPALLLDRDGYSDAVTREDRLKDTVTLKLYPASRVHPDDLMDLRRPQHPCPTSERTKVLELELNSCLSGEYYLQDVLKVTHLPRCGDGSLPHARYYPRRDCEGDPGIYNSTPGLHECLWSKDQIRNPSYYWSLAFSCSRELSSPILRHVIAPPSLAVGDKQGHRQGAMSFWTTGCEERGIFPQDLAVAIDTLPKSVDKCWGVEFTHPIEPRFWPGKTNVLVQTHGICKDGTRARLAWVKKIITSSVISPCRIEGIQIDNQLVDISDGDLDSCIKSPEFLLSTEYHEISPEGAVLYCGGHVKPDDSRLLYPPKLPPADAVVPHFHGRRPNETDRPITLFPVPTEHCVNLPIGRSHVTYSNAICSNGWGAFFAIWPQADCVGPPIWAGSSPNIIRGSNPFDSLSGTTFDHYVSYQFWCTGKEHVKGLQQRILSAATKERIVYSKDACSYPIDVGYDYEPPNPPPRNITTIGTCIRAHAREWCIYQNAVCPDGQQAQLASWYNSDCNGSPVEVHALLPEDSSSCFAMCPGTKSVVAHLYVYGNGIDISKSSFERLYNC